jgi:hypothetical protein
MNCSKFISNTLLPESTVSITSAASLTRVIKLIQSRFCLDEHAMTGLRIRKSVFCSSFLDILFEEVISTLIQMADVLEYIKRVIIS